jgi:hypothetical protein
VAISQDGVAKLSEYSRIDPMVMCQHCALAVVPSHAQLMLTKNGAEQAESNAQAKRTLDEFIRRTGHA